MRRTVRGQRAPSIQFNATPLIDVIFILTIFFMLVSRFVSQELVAMQLPNPEQSQAKAVKVPDRVVINCRIDERSDAAFPKALYSLGPNRPEPLDSIARRLAAFKEAQPGLKVVVRADRRLPYAQVRAVLGILAAERIDMLNVVAHVSESP